jgi:hypothetical protein
LLYCHGLVKLIELWENPDFTVGMEEGGIRQISLNGNFLLSYDDWVKWKEEDNKFLRWIAYVSIILAGFGGYFSFKPRKVRFKEYSQVQSSRRHVSDAAERLVITFKRLENISEWLTLKDIPRYRRVLDSEQLEQFDQALFDFEDALKATNQSLKKIGSQIHG